MAKIGKVKKTFFVAYTGLLKDLEFGLAESIEEAKSNSIKSHKKIFGKNVTVQFT